MKIPETILQQDDYQRCAEFHGHVCMGLTLGYFAARIALQLLEEKRALDEELVCIAETDACGCDAIQVLTGCTFGKGNFFYRDIGKMAFTFGSRTTGKGLRVSMKPGILDIPEEESALKELVRDGSASPTEISAYERLYESRSTEIFTAGPAALFNVTEVALALPPTARVAPSAICSMCGEPVMATKLVATEDGKICRSCVYSAG